MADSGETDLVATLLPNREVAAAAFAAWDAGTALLPLNPALPAHEIRRLLDAARPTRLIDTDGEHRLPHGLPVPDGTAAVLCTSGTTGDPKAVELTRAGMEVMGRGVSAAVGASPHDRWLACHGLYFVAGLAILGRSAVTGVPVVVHQGFDLERVARAPRHEGATIVSVVPTTLRRMVAAGALDGYRAVIVGGAPLPDALRAEVVATGVEVYDAYGLTETWGGCVTNGRPNDGVEARLDPTTHEILLRGAPVMRGYRSPAAAGPADASYDRAGALDPDGWLHTGDVGGIDADGRLRVVDRIKDLVISGGVNVSPVEVEHVLAGHPDVADVCVVGRPDPEWGERVVAFVVPRSGGSPPTLDDLRRYARALLAPAKAPREMHLIPEIPRSPSGKPLRRVLRDQPGTPGTPTA